MMRGTKPSRLLIVVSAITAIPVVLIALAMTAAAIWMMYAVFVHSLVVGVIAIGLLSVPIWIGLTLGRRLREQAKRKPARR
jgi:hypothetical protein